MEKISRVMFLVVAIAALGALGVTTALTTVHDAQAQVTNCHNTKGSNGCTFGKEGGFNTNKKKCNDHGFLEGTCNLD